MRGLGVSILAVLSSAVLAVPMRHDARRRAEAAGWVQKLLAGEVVRATSRVTYLGEQAFAADALVDALERNSAPLIFIAQGLMLLGVKEGERGLVKLSRDGDPAIRLLAAQGLGRIQSRRADVVLPLLRDAQPAVRREAARALGGMRDPRHGRVLFDVAQAEADLTTRAIMLEAVGSAGDKRQGDRLVPFLRSASESAQWAAARALCLLENPKGLRFANEHLKSPHEAQRRLAVDLLEGVSLKRIEPLLRARLDDTAAPVAAAAARVLARAGDRQALAWLVRAVDTASFESRPVFANELEKLGLSDAERQKAREHDVPLAPLKPKEPEPKEPRRR
ncbi:MAG: HEAT repeat domain-containing protein [Myxococcaceae bacterium]